MQGDEQRVEWSEIRERFLAVADDVDQLADDIAEHLREQPQSNPEVGRFDPRSSLTKLAQFVASVKFAAEEHRRKAERIETGANHAE